jgi:hypothetical protein
VGGHGAIGVFFDEEVEVAAGLCERVLLVGGIEAGIRSERQVERKES